MRICANTANDDANKNKFKTQKSKVKTGHRMSKGHPMSQILISKKAKWNNPFYNFVIARSRATKQSPSFRRVIASPPNHRGTKQSLWMNYELWIINNSKFRMLSKNFFQKFLLSYNHFEFWILHFEFFLAYCLFLIIFL